MSTQVSNPYSFKIVNNETFNASIVNDLTITGNAEFYQNGTGNYFALTTQAFIAGNDKVSMPAQGSFSQTNGGKITLMSFGISVHGDFLFSAISYIFIKSSSNIINHAVYIEIDDIYRVGAYLGFKDKNNNDIYSNVNSDQYYESTMEKKNGSNFSEVPASDVAKYIVSKNYKCNLVVYIEAI